MGQDVRARVRAETRRLLAAGVSGQVFPGAVACVSWRGEDGATVRVLATAGARVASGQRVTEDTWYDLGGITQSVVAIAALRAAARGAVDLDAPVEKTISHVRGGVLGGVSLRGLLGHRGGLARWGALYLDVPHDVGSPAAQRWMLSEAARRAGEVAAGEPAQSDLGYMIAGAALAQACRSSLAEVVSREVLTPLSLEDMLLYPGALPTEKRNAIAALSAPTERCPWRGRLLQGEAQDENAAALGGVAGHAGMFGVAAGVARFGEAVLDAARGRSQLLKRAALAAALPPGEPIGCGFVRRPSGQSAWGKRMSPDAFGQLAFTGASLLVDPGADAVVVLLSNRICPSRANTKIDGFRPAFHDGVLAALVG